LIEALVLQVIIVHIVVIGYI